MSDTRTTAASLILAALMVGSVVAVAAPSGAVAGTGDPATLHAGAGAGQDAADAAGAATLVVDDDGGGGYDSIGQAIFEASDGDTVEVRPGTYEEPLFVDKNITLVAPDGATLDGSTADSDDSAIRPVNYDGVVVEGFTITNWGTGVEIEKRPGSTGGVTLRDLTVRGNTYTGVTAGFQDSDWTLVDSTIENNGRSGVFAYNSTGDWTVADTTVRDNGRYGFEVHESTGNWRIVDSTVADNAKDGIIASGTDGDWTVRGSELRDNGDPSDRIPEVGVRAAGATGNWTLVDTTVTGNDHGVDADDTTGAWSVVDSNVSNNTFPQGPGEVGIGIEARDASGAWSVEETTVSGEVIGVATSGSSGAWRIRSAEVTDNAIGVLALDTSGAWSIHSSTVADNDLHGVNATGAAPEGDATRNWWGQASGPLSGQCVGNVDCGDARTRPPNPPLSSCQVITRSGTYEVVADIASDGTCLEIRASDVTIDGMGHTLTGQNPNTRKIGIYANGTAGGISNVTVRDLNLTGWAGSPGTAVRYEGVTDGELSGVDVTGSDRGVRLVDSPDSRVSDVNVTGTSRGNQGIAVLSGSNRVTVSDSRVFRAGAFGLLVEAANATVRGVELSRSEDANLHLSGGADDATVADSYIHDSAWGGPIYSRGVTAGGIRNLTFRNNTVSGNPNDGVHLSQSGRDHLFVDNDLSANGADGLSLSYTADVTLRNNTVSNNSVNGIELKNSAKHAVRDNTVRSNDGFGITLHSVRNATIAANTVEYHDNGGIRIGSGATDNELRDNAVTNVPTRNTAAFPTGIRFAGGDGNALTNNTVVNGWRGIDVNASSNGNTLTDNAVYDAGSATWALTIGDSRNTTVTRLDIGDSPTANTTLSFGGHNVSVAPNTSLPTHPDATGIDRGFEVRTAGPRAYLNVTVHYDSADLAGITADRLRLVGTDSGQSWAGPNVQRWDATARTVHANLSYQLSIGRDVWGAFAFEDATPTPSATPTPTSTTSGSSAGTSTASGTPTATDTPTAAGGPTPTATATPTSTPQGTSGGGPGFGIAAALAALALVALARTRRE